MKRLTQTLAFCLLTVFTAVAQKNYVSEVWVSDLGNGKYKNPVLYARRVTIRIRIGSPTFSENSKPLYTISYASC